MNVSSHVGEWVLKSGLVLFLCINRWMGDGRQHHSPQLRLWPCTPGTVGQTRSTGRVAGGILHGTGIIRDGELRFQNSDGTQFAFRPGIADLIGRMTTPNGQSYEAAFKKSL